MGRGMKQMAKDIPHELREKILLKWLPTARPSLDDMNFKLLWEAYFIYIDPSGIQKTDCDRCKHNVLTNWKLLQPSLIAAEKNYNIIETL